jgi:hypothetical protein
MKWFAKTLWDLMSQDSRAARRRKPAHLTSLAPGRANGERSASPSGNGVAKHGLTMQDKYDAIVIEMKQAYGVRIRKWRSNSTGCAWEIRYANGTTNRLLESPYPRGPMSCAIFLHEIGHHAIGFGTYRPRCLEEFYAWKWALDTMRSRGLNVTPPVEKRMADSLRYAVAKARRRGLAQLPQELEPYV